jgi:NADH:ubiquinone oxidoreductase subunit 6 (subunit J)
MLEHVHNHITKELEQNTKTDIIFILTAIVLNLITLGINSGLAEKSRTENSTLIVMFVFVTLIVLVNLVVIIGLLKGRQTRTKLVNGLLTMYKDQNVAKYYDESLLGNYNVRYNLFIMVVVCTGVIAAIVPFISR